MDDEEAIVVAISTAIAQTAVLLSATCDPAPPRPKKQILTVTVLDFEPMLLSASCESWFEANLRCTKKTFLLIASFLRRQNILFAGVNSKRHSYNKKVAGALYFLGSAGGYREVGAAMGMSRSYVQEITTEVVRVLRAVAPYVVSFPRDQHGWDAIESGFAARHGYPGVIGAIDGSLIEIERPEEFDGFYCRKCYPALNVQAIVTTDNIFLSAEVRPGSWSDRNAGNTAELAKRYTRRSLLELILLATLVMRCSPGY